MNRQRNTDNSFIGIRKEITYSVSPSTSVLFCMYWFFCVIGSTDIIPQSSKMGFTPGIEFTLGSENP